MSNLPTFTKECTCDECYKTFTTHMYDENEVCTSCRSMRALERIGNASARRTLDRAARNDPDARVRRLARHLQRQAEEEAAAEDRALRHRVGGGVVTGGGLASGLAGGLAMTTNAAKASTIRLRM